MALTLRPHHGRFSSAGCTRFGALFPEHRRIFQHVWQYHKTNFRSTYIDILQIGSSSIAIRYRNLCHLAIHIVLGFDQLAAIHFTGYRFARYNVAFGFVQDFDRYTNRHFCRGVSVVLLVKFQRKMWFLQKLFENVYYLRFANAKKRRRQAGGDFLTVKKYTREEKFCSRIRRRLCRTVESR